ncbi:glycoside hydrolase [Meredithblackwellia eburnea MCA 4105]
MRTSSALISAAALLFQSVSAQQGVSGFGRSSSVGNNFIVQAPATGGKSAGNMNLEMGVTDSAPADVTPAVGTYNPDVLAITYQNLSDNVKAGPNRTAALSAPIRGVNVGGWLLIEPWMYPSRWVGMGGQWGPFNDGGNCTTRVESEWALGNKIQNQSALNVVVQTHYDSWFNQTHVDTLAYLGLNTVRIPLGFWVVEALVNRTTEFYAQGGMDFLVSRLAMLAEQNISVILDHHALPGVATPMQSFAGNCTDQVNFYEEANYERAVTWAMVMTFLSHIHPAFSTVKSINAMNEPIQDASQTPGLDDYYGNVVTAIRVVEVALGIVCDEGIYTSPYLTSPMFINAAVAAIPIMIDLGTQYNLGDDLIGLLKTNFLGSDLTNITNIVGTLSSFVSGSETNEAQCLATSFMDSSWQYAVNDTITVANPADHVLGPALYDNHFYLGYGYVAPNATPEAYLETVCNSSRVVSAAQAGDAPLYFGEWSLGTEWNDTTIDFLKNFADAQRKIYSQGQGWLFWAMKVDPDANCNGDCNKWSYFDAVDAGIFPRDPDAYWDSNLCANYTAQPNNTSTNASSGAQGNPSTAVASPAATKRARRF